MSRRWVGSCGGWLTEPAAALFTDYVTPGNFEMIGFGFTGTPFPVTSTYNIYTTDGEQNYGHIASKEIGYTK